MFKKAAAILAGTALTLSFATATDAAKFKDVPDSHSLQLEIEYLANQGIINGYSDGTFKPNAPIAKKHIAKMMVEALDLPTTNLKALPYKDVPKTHPYYTEIAAAYTAGIFGDGENFKPESSISRAFMAKMMVASFDLRNEDEEFFFSQYDDVSEDNEFFNPIHIVTANNIAKGSFSEEDGTSTFSPNQLLTRAHFSAFLARAISIGEGTYTPDPRYTYFYDKGYNGEPLRLQLDSSSIEDDEVYITWNVSNTKTHEEYEQISYSTFMNIWAYSDEEELKELHYPFTVGVKMQDEHYKLAVLDGNGTYTIGGTTYDNVVVVYERFNENGTSRERTLYIAENYGIVGVEGQNGFEQLLTKRELQ